MVEVSSGMKKYFEVIQNQVNQCYDIAERARQKGLDPELEVESPQARDLAGRVEKLVGPEGVAEIIREAKKQGKSDDEIAFQVVSDILDGKIGKIDSVELRVERAIRVGLAIKTMGVVSAPLEGISKILIKQDQQGNKYLSLYFAGPIRAAGGTTAALCVLIADFVRRKSKIPEYRATEGEIGRYVEEVKLYDRRVHLQYPSSNDEIRFAVEHLPVEINGDSTEDEEVSAFRDLPRIETNHIRGGACLVLNDGVILKAPKLLKIANTMNLEGWDWLAELKKIANKEEKKENKKIKEEKRDSEEKKIAPNYKYVADIIAGRPVFSHPSEIGGHRIRYGRARNTGLAAGGLHPATMAILDDFVAIGTQLRIERPGKSSSICPVSSIEPPIVKLKGGDVIRVKSPKTAKEIKPKIDQILFLGDILFGFGEFAENNHKLVPSGYVEEWWALELEKAVQNRDEDVEKYYINPFENIPTAEEAIRICKKYNIPLHPRYLNFWGNITINELISLREGLIEGFDESEDRIILENKEFIKNILEKAFILHKIINGKISISKNMTRVYETIFDLHNKKAFKTSETDTVFTYFDKMSPVKIKNKAPYYMGTRMGRPEKSERKSMKGIHSLFPLSDKVGNSRLVEKAMEIEIGDKKEEKEKNKDVNITVAEKKKFRINIDVCRKECPSCGGTTIFNLCPKCKVHTEVRSICENCKKRFPPIDPKGETRCPQCGEELKSSSEATFNIKSYIKSTLKSLQLPFPKNLKGIIGLTNKFKIPEPIEKGILRAKNDVLVYKTAEIRYDATDIPLTHFKPKEIGTTIEQLKELGYVNDHKGNPIHDDDQIIELKVQDLLLSYDCADYMNKVANFLDEELDFFYKMERFYNIKNRQGLIGHLVVGLAPHTSAGIIGRIIGFSPARSIYAHPFWHAAKRRNCFPGNTKILVDFNGKVKKISLRKLYNDYYEGESFEKMTYIKEKPLENIKAYSYDKDSGDIRITAIKDVIKIPYSNKLVKFRLKTGRGFKTTLDHPVLVFSNGRIIEKRAIDVVKTDKFLLPSLKFETNDIEKFDLIKEFYKNEFKSIWNDLMVRGIRNFIRGLIHKLGLQISAEKLNINKKILNNYYGSRDSIPFDILIRLLKIHKLTIDNIPDCELGFKRDHTTVNRYVQVDKSFMKICGYYIAEGFYRKIPRGYQVDFAISERDLREDMLASIYESFGNGFKPYIDENRITISNRVLYHFFKDIVKFKNKARLKNIPALFFKLPKNKIKHLLAAYFSGDGGLDICRKTINCSSASLRLIHAIDTLLLRFSIFSGISKFKKNNSIEYKLRIRGVNVFKFNNEIGFTSIRKAKVLKNIVKIKQTIPEKTYQNHRLLGIRDIKQCSSDENYVYSLNADKYHTIIINDNIITHQCDGDEDGIMLLLDPLLNFSRYYLPSKIGGRMDATLVISTILDPNEIDVEAHNIDTSSKYPLEFYEATEQYTSPNEIESIMNLVKSRLGTSEQYENLGFNIPTEDINEGPIMSKYKIGDIDDKLNAQLQLAKIIKAVNAKKVASQILVTHFNPDILGNLRKFATQEFRCVKCNTKFRRPPLSNEGKCPLCGNNIILTVHRGGIEKYISRALMLCKDFNLDNYTVQRMELVGDYVESLTNNPKIKQQKLSDFF